MFAEARLVGGRAGHCFERREFMELREASRVNALPRADMPAELTPTPCISARHPRTET